MKFLLFLLIPALILTACDHDEEEISGVCGFGHDKLNFVSPYVGLKSLYLGFSGEKYGNPDFHYSYNYHTDTLVLEIIEQEGNQHLLAEYWKKGSEHFTGQDTVLHWFWTADDTLYLHYQSEGFNQSDFFTAYSLKQWSSTDTLKIPLLAFDSTKANVSGWQLDISFAESYGEYLVDSWWLFDKEYNNLNAIINNTPMQVDGNGTSYIYSAESGFVRSVTYSSWTLEGQGWDLLSD